MNCHIKSFPDADYQSRKVTLLELQQGGYKARVNEESCLTDIRKYDKKRMTNVICMNLKKMELFVQESIQTDDLYAPLYSVLLEQNRFLHEKLCFYVLNTCVLFVYEYNPSFVNIR